MKTLILYSKPGCHLCEGLAEKLAQSQLPFTLEVRDITQNPEWFQKYQYEIPVLCKLSQQASGLAEQALPRLSPRAPLRQVERMLRNHLNFSTVE
ncbi:glutaredoxin family protein [Romeria aff. gracilis LEGE 07310]|uniref:Glutaredoxin family protein n=1 Tax=Vasconcelosia minhoensis LEGE 07310 TaxID=915328 RepID=A0A8J7A6K4_9CYAN|nr:glutaredoxin family protein [Romeria gracilis]MBE9076885.1 glutaredoxin family protein [Romeria aff. gracilis LEGE 07310]